MMASLVTCGRRLWRRAARVFVAVVVAVGVCVVCVHAAFADHPAPGGRVQLSVYPSFCLKGLMHDE